MTKTFCDLCGQPAFGDAYFHVPFPDRRWTGHGKILGMMNEVDKVWTPFIRLELGLTACAFKDRPEFGPDLCKDCLVNVLQTAIKELSE